MRAEIDAAQEAMVVGETPEEGGPKQYRRAEAEAEAEAEQDAMEVGEAPGGRPDTIQEGGGEGGIEKNEPDDETHTGTRPRQHHRKLNTYDWEHVEQQG